MRPMPGNQAIVLYINGEPPGAAPTRDCTAKLVFNPKFQDLEVTHIFTENVERPLYISLNPARYYCKPCCAAAWHTGPDTVGNEDGGCSREDELDKLGIDDINGNEGDPLCPLFVEDPPEPHDGPEADPTWCKVCGDPFCHGCEE